MVDKSVDTNTLKLLQRFVTMKSNYLYMERIQFMAKNAIRVFDNHVLTKRFSMPNLVKIIEWFSLSQLIINNSDEEFNTYQKNSEVSQMITLAFDPVTGVITRLVTSTLGPGFVVKVPEYTLSIGPILKIKIK